ncbi:hypothetical protein BGX21_009887 [Mortierella sp. AD011]|nr:hypothetical protein BGX20_009932 [Mortierella sp. AD010]KAF9395468.1 hypothetical protein BGX21_009887 [Mortierella sp. AD011]
MAASIRSVAMGLPKVSMARIPLVAFANSHVAPVSHANSSHPSTFTSMSPHNDKADSWAKTAKKTADRLEQSAQKLGGTQESKTKDYLDEVNRFSNAEDNLMKDVSIAMNSPKAAGKNSSHKAHQSGDHHNRHGGRDDRIIGAPTSFEQTFVDQVQADLIPPSTSKLSHDKKHDKETVASLLEELKGDKNGANLSKHASEAIRMVESQNILKHDKAPMNTVGDLDPTQKPIESHEHKSKFPF